MKIKNITFILLVAFLFLINSSWKCFAMNTGLTTVEMNNDSKQMFFSNTILSPIEDMPDNMTIDFFDVNESGQIAMILGEASTKYVAVYNSDGIFEYGFKFSDYGNVGVEWDREYLILYFVRSDVAAAFDNRGRCVELRMIENTTNNNSYWNHHISATTRTKNGSTYTIQNRMGLFNWFCTGYSQLVQTDNQGHERILYDVKSAHTTRIVVEIFVIVSFVVIVFLAIGKHFKRLK